MEARHAGTQWLRPLSAGAVLAVAAFMLLWSPFVRRSGPELFAALHHVVLVTIWLLVPMMTADCISRERREQTLGLLFLTPLTAGEVVLAKVLAHGLRAATVWAAVFPVLLLPLLMGGVAASTVWAAMMAQVGAFFWALGAGILASVMSRSVLGGLGWALLLVLLFLVAQASLNGLAVHLAIAKFSGVLPSAEWLVGIGLLALWNPETVLDGFLRLLAPASRGTWMWLCILVPMVSAFGLALVWGIGAWRLRRAWQEQPASRQRERVTREFVRLRFAPGWLRARLRRQMERNPVGWLERRRWRSRTAVWSWVGLLALAQVTLLTGPGRIEDVRELNGLLAVALCGVMALVSAASFRREREMGVLELLLTTSLTPRQIVAGRVMGLWRQFLPAVVLFSGVSVYIDVQLSGRWWGRWWDRSSSMLTEDLLFLACLFFTIPVGGLWWSLRARTYVGGVILTVTTMGLLPWAGSLGLNFLVAENVAWAQVGELFLFVVLPIVVMVGIGALQPVVGPMWWLMLAAWCSLAALSWVSRFSNWQYLVMSALLFAAGGFMVRRLVRELESRGSSASMASTRPGESG